MSLSGATADDKVRRIFPALIAASAWAACSTPIVDLGGQRAIADAGASTPSTSASSGGSTSGSSSSTGTGTGGSTTGGGSSGGSSGASATSGGSTGGGTDGGDALQGPGFPCSADSQCLSGVCGINGAGLCCSHACDTGDAQCGANACSDTGACLFPGSETDCGDAGSSCQGGTLLSARCDGTGACGDPLSADCPGHYECSNATTCATQCANWRNIPGFCEDGYKCVFHFTTARYVWVCEPKPKTGPCAGSGTCFSGVCLGGNCCTAACDTSDTQCGAGYCDATGACVFPGAHVSCGVCTGSTTRTLGTCDGTGGCGSSPSTCDGGDVCDGQNTCCAAPGAIVYVDNILGVNRPCCGTAGNPCQTLTRAMNFIAHAEATGVTILATVDGGGGDWIVEGAIPVNLGWGVTLSAPGVYFSDANPLGGASLFDVTAQGGDSSGYAVIEGTGAGANQVIIGSNSAGNQLTYTAAVAVEDGMTLYIGNAYVNGSSANFPATLHAIQVNAGGRLVLGQDAGGPTGPVTIGGNLPNGTAGLSGENGIYCGGTSAKNATVTDAFPGGLGFSSVTISNQAVADIDAEDFCTVDLESSPVLGTKPSGGIGTCTAKVDGIGLLANGAATITLGSSAGPATVQCIQGGGIDLEASANGNGSPAVLLDHATVQNTEIGLVANDGTATALGSTIQNSYRGVIQNNAATIDLTGDGGATPNTVICSSSKESFSGATAPGIDVWNQGANSLAADYVTWDTTGPDYFSCDSMFTSCSCLLTGCTTTVGADDMDAVEDSTALGGITTTHPSQSSANCK